MSNWVNYDPAVSINLQRIFQHSAAEYLQWGQANLFRQDRIEANRNQGRPDVVTGFWRLTASRQISDNPNYFKYVDTFPDLQYTLPLDEIYQRYSDWMFLGVVDVDVRLYTTGTDLQPLETTPAYELMYAPKVKAFLEDCKFIYLPVDTFGGTSSTYSLIPSLEEWGPESEEIVLVRPLKEPIRMIQPISMSYRTIITGNLYHPFYPAHAYSGRTYLSPSGTLLYEYFDNAGYYSPLDSILLAPERPFFLDFPLGIPMGGQLIQVPSSAEGFYPERGRGDHQGIYTGYQTTNSYDSSRTWYLYERADRTTFLSEYRPTREEIPELSLYSYLTLMSQYEVTA
jgi:hypothetical protein